MIFVYEIYLFVTCIFQSAYLCFFNIRLASCESAMYAKIIWSPNIVWVSHPASKWMKEGVLSWACISKLFPSLCVESKAKVNPTTTSSIRLTQPLPVNRYIQMDGRLEEYWRENPIIGSVFSRGKTIMPRLVIIIMIHIWGSCIFHMISSSSASDLLANPKCISSNAKV